MDRRLLRQEVFDILLRSILTGELQPNARLRDEELTAWLGVSRTPVREALGDLAMLGLVKSVPNQHTRVAPLDEREAIDLIDVLCVLYPECLQLVDAQLTAAHCAAALKRSKGLTSLSYEEVINQVLDLGAAIGGSVRNQSLARTASILQLKLIRLLRADPTLLGKYASPSGLPQFLNTLVSRPELAEGMVIDALRSVQQRLRSKLENSARSY